MPLYQAASHLGREAPTKSEPKLAYLPLTCWYAELGPKDRESKATYIKYNVIISMRIQYCEHGDFSLNASID